MLSKKPFILIKEHFFVILYIILFFGLLLIQKFGFNWSYYFLIVWFGFGINRIVFSKSLSIFTNLLLSWFTATAVLIVYGSLLNLAGLPINQYSILFLIISILGLFTFNHQRFQLKLASMQIDKFDLLAVIIILSALIAKVISIRDFYAPILHDPMSHAEWAKTIVETGFANYFYSPGLHIIAAIGELMSGFNVAKQILLITNIFNALIGLPIYVYLQEKTKSSWWAITALILFSLGSYPTNLYITAGKNAFIVSTSFVIFVLYYVINNPQRDWKTISFSNTLIFALIMTHYPNGFIAAIFVASYYLLNLSQIKKALLLLPGYLLAAFWGLTKYFQNKAEILNPEYISFMSDRYEVSLSYFKKILISTWRASITTLGTGIESKILLFLSLLGLMIFLFITIKKKKQIWILISLGFFIVLMLIIEFFKLQTIQIVYETQVQFSFVIFYLSAAFIIGEVISPRLEKHWKYTFILIFGIFLIYTSFTAFHIYKSYQAKQLKVNMVTKYDREVFSWIQSNISSDKVILNNGIMGAQGRVFPTDSGGWIPAFIFREISMPFSDYSTLNTYENLLLHQSLMKEPGNCVLINQLLERNIEYYFSGKNEIYGGSIKINDELISNGTYELLYEARGAKIFKIIGCDP